jgi:hypothetical protein
VTSYHVAMHCTHPFHLELNLKSSHIEFSFIFKSFHFLLDEVEQKLIDFTCQIYNKKRNQLQVELGSNLIEVRQCMWKRRLIQILNRPLTAKDLMRVLNLNGPQLLGSILHLGLHTSRV